MNMDTIRVEAFLADAIESANGKLYALGIGWDQIASVDGRFPVVHHSVSVGVVVHVPYRMTNENHELKVYMVDQDSNRQVLNPGGHVPDGEDPLTVIGGDFNVGRPPGIAPGDEQVMALAFNLRGLAFPKPDLYSIVVEVDATEACRLPLRVRMVPPGSRPNVAR